MAAPGVSVDEILEWQEIAYDAFLKQALKEEWNRMNQKTLIVYKSTTGFTRKYAKLAGKETRSKGIEYQKATAKLVSGYDTAVFGSRAHAGRMNGYHRIKKMFQKNGAKQMVFP